MTGSLWRQQDKKQKNSNSQFEMVSTALNDKNDRTISTIKLLLLTLNWMVSFFIVFIVISFLSLFVTFCFYPVGASPILLSCYFFDRGLQDKN